MRNELVIYHRGLKGSENSCFLNEPGLARWTTCVRSLLIGTPDIKTGQQYDEVYRGEEATRFLTEIVAGLKSPMLGETEVHGQFKEFIGQIENEVSEELFLELMSVHFLARKVRSEFLKNLGCQSYGSFARKKMKEVKELTIFGSGQLAKEILPWLVKKRNPVNVICRSPNTIADESLALENVNVLNYENIPSQIEGLIITAPLQASEIHSLIENRGTQYILDFRGESRHDQLDSQLGAISLDDVFEEIETQKYQVEQQVRKAQQFIEDSIQDLESVVGRALKSIKVS